MRCSVVKKNCFYPATLVSLILAACDIYETLTNIACGNIDGLFGRWRKFIASSRGGGFQLRASIVGEPLSPCVWESVFVSKLLFRRHLLRPRTVAVQFVKSIRFDRQSSCFGVGIPTILNGFRKRSLVSAGKNSGSYESEGGLVESSCNDRKRRETNGRESHSSDVPYRRVGVGLLLEREGHGRIRRWSRKKICEPVSSRPNSLLTGQQGFDLGFPSTSFLIFCCIESGSRA